ncbi:hypothetical protein DYB31_006176 [Aphanomyces astaci]|uniref:ORC1/DEAH AAA+ ATPase domain-containing protein n=2 Tax=Aphanomyces astaci TaxID=112090 RepID=A0A397ETE5_APHAT|nr:hypothetical protein DYB31_006176 [Aphanomyces astaci]
MSTSVAPSTEMPPPLTGQQVHCVRHVVLSRRLASGWTGVDAAVQDIQRVVERTVLYGENQSAMLVGSSGSGKRAVVAKALAQLPTRTFHTVYLSGSVLGNDMEAFREIVQQLVPQQGSIVGHAAISFFNMYDLLKQLLLQKALQEHAVIFILDAFDAFVTGAKQLLVYNLLDWMQSKDVRVALVGISCNFNVLAQFEKRVKSRFSNIQVVVPRPPLKHILQATTTMMENVVNWPAHIPAPPDAFHEHWDTSLHRLLFDQTHWWWQYLYDLGKPTDVFVQLLHVAMTHLTPSAPCLTTREMTLVLGMIGLERRHVAPYSFEMVFHECQAFYRQHALQYPKRRELLDALSNLLATHVVHPATTKQQHQPEYCLVRLVLRPTDVLDAIRRKLVPVTTVVDQWATNTLQ